jgi:hypothetical protein
MNTIATDRAPTFVARDAELAGVVEPKRTEIEPEN